MLSTALGVLINLAESCPEVREEVAVAPGSAAGAGGGAPGGAALLQLLCRLVSSSKRCGSAAEGVETAAVRRFRVGQGVST